MYFLGSLNQGHLKHFIFFLTCTPEKSPSISLFYSLLWIYIFWMVFAQWSDSAVFSMNVFCWYSRIYSLVSVLSRSLIILESPIVLATDFPIACMVASFFFFVVAEFMVPCFSSRFSCAPPSLCGCELLVLDHSKFSFAMAAVPFLIWKGFILVGTLRLTLGLFICDITKVLLNVIKYKYYIKLEKS